jgi:hypothetical protein
MSGLVKGVAHEADAKQAGGAMSSGDFAVGLSTIITGLAITVILADFHGLLVNRRKVKWDWVAILAALFIFILIVGSWGVSFKMMGNRSINPPLWLFLVLLGEIIPLYLAARTALPDQLLDEGVDLGKHYALVSRYMWSSVAFSYVLFLAWGFAKWGGMGELQRQWPLIAQVIAIIPLILFRQRRVHEILVPLVLLLFCIHHLNEPLFA